MTFGRKGRLGLVIPANNSVLEPELWPALPPDTAIFATRILAKGALTVAAVRAMEAEVDAAIERIAATDVDAIGYCDMVTTFIMERGWSEHRMDEISAEVGRPTFSAWTALRDAMAELGVRRIALGTPYPRAVHALAAPFFRSHGLEVVTDDTLDIEAMLEVPKVEPDRLMAFAAPLAAAEADALVLLATDLPTFGVLDRLEAAAGKPVLTSNQTLLWAGLRACGWRGRIGGLGRLLQTV
jgi:maleate isomerase